MVFVTDPNSESVIRQSLADLSVNDAAFTRGNVETARAALAVQASPKLLIIDISNITDPMARIYELAEICEPNVGVIVIGAQNDIAIYRQLKKAGISEYFFKPLIRDFVKRACNNILFGEHEQASSPRTGKLILVLGVRGGVGATMIAANAARYMAEIRQRWVMLVDLDLQSGDAALQLDVTPSHALFEALEHPDRIDKLFIERGRIRVTDRLDALASLEPLGESFKINEESVISLLEALTQRYRYIFVDVPGFIATELLRVMRQPRDIILVSNGSITSARDLVRWRELIGPNTHERKTLHVLNMKGARGDLPEAEFTRAVGQAPDITIPFSREIASASTLGVKATVRCAELHRGLIQILREVAGESKAPPPPSFLQRIFGGT